MIAYNVPDYSYTNDISVLTVVSDTTDENISYSDQEDEQEKNSSLPEKEDVEVSFPDEQEQIENLQSEISVFIYDADKFLKIATTKKTALEEVQKSSSDALKNILLTIMGIAVIIVFYFVFKKD